jgi:hypothetical protein
MGGNENNSGLRHAIFELAIFCDVQVFVLCVLESGSGMVSDLDTSAIVVLASSSCHNMIC